MPWRRMLSGPPSSSTAAALGELLVSACGWVEGHVSSTSAMLVLGIAYALKKDAGWASLIQHCRSSGCARLCLPT